MPTTSVIAIDYEERLIPFSALVNYLKSQVILTDTLVAAAADVADLITRTYAALKSGTIDLFGPEARLAVERFEQHIKLMELLALIDDTKAALLETVNTVEAGTDLRYLVSSIITLAGYDKTSTAWKGFDTHTAYAVTG